MIDGFVSYYLADFYLKYADFNEECKAKNEAFTNFEELQNKWRSGQALTPTEYRSMTGYLMNHWADRVHPCFKKLNFEEVFDSNNVSGLDVMEKCPGGAEDCNPGSKHAPPPYVPETCT